jgi:hypothetical protein
LQPKIITGSYGLSGVSAMADWMDGEVDMPEATLTGGQIFALLRMTALLDDPIILHAVYVIKGSIAASEFDAAKESWVELSEEEQTALWVAPKFGGIFSTEERKAIKGGFKDE